MATIQENRHTWGEVFDWENLEQYWSARWGGESMHWYGTVLPRIHPYLPAQTILEIAPGYGRWSRFLKDHCQKLLLVDIVPKCIEKCRQRFADCSHLSYHVNDGKSLPMVEDQSIDFIFSLDSLVHADDETISAYLGEFARKMKSDGVAIIQHSNLGSYPGYYGIYSKLIDPVLTKTGKLQDLLNNKWGLDNVVRGWRSPTMTHSKFASLCRDHKLSCIGQELIPWRTRHVLIDCISVIVHAGSKWDREPRVQKNPGFQKEWRYLFELSKTY